ncbi:MAG: hypothetical protein K0S55_1031 [Clostridia bacterium]|nr:hypothetical protein [Clostridia bacterium]
MINKSKVGMRIAELRKNIGYSQAKLAEQLNISTQAVSRWETGITLADAEQLLKLSGIFGVTINYLLLGKGISIGNDELEIEIRKILNNTEDELTEEELLLITDMEIGCNLKLKSLKGLKYLKNLRKLSIKNIYNYIDDLTEISMLTYLKEFYCGYDIYNQPAKQAVSLEFLRGLTTLEVLNIAGVKLRDLSPISTLTNLNKVWLCDDMIDDISAFKPLKKLIWVILFDNRIIDISPLENSTELEFIDISMNLVENLAPLKNCKKLKGINAHTNRFSDASSLEDLINLEALTLENNYISDISALVKLPKLKELTLSLNQYLKDITPLKKMKALENVSLFNMDISEETRAELNEALPDCNFIYIQDT